MVSKKTSIILLLCSIGLLVATGLLINPVAQPLSYHNFADQREFLGTTNALDVFSNILFAAGGIWGLFLLFSHGKLQFVDNRARWLWAGVCVGLILTALGSGYYHMMPDNARLVWDRLPMTIIFMSYVAALIGERINMNLGLWLWPVLLAVGFYSVLYWEASELQGHGDLRMYAGVQVFTILVTLVMLFTPSPYDRRWDLAVIVLLFGLARVFEIFDQQILLYSGKFISGHTLKHIAAGVAGIWIIFMIKNRKIVHTRL